VASKAKKSSSHTKTGKTLLGPLNVRQLTEMLDKASKPKEKSKIQRRLTELKSRPGYVEPVVEAVAE
jgi:putative component of toxin-antitoxin plasmid stabilization module